MTTKQRNFFIIFLIGLLLLISGVFVMQVSFAEAWAQTQISFRGVTYGTDYDLVSREAKARATKVDRSSKDGTLSYTVNIFNVKASMSLKEYRSLANRKIKIENINITFDPDIVTNQEKYEELSEEVFDDLRSKYGPPFVKQTELLDEGKSTERKDIVALWIYLSPQDRVLSQVEFRNNFALKTSPTVVYSFKNAENSSSQLRFFYLWLRYSERGQFLADWMVKLGLA